MRMREPSGGAGPHVSAEGFHQLWNSFNHGWIETNLIVLGAEQIWVERGETIVELGLGKTPASFIDCRHGTPSAEG